MTFTMPEAISDSSTLINLAITGHLSLHLECPTPYDL